ncbi:MAG: prolyl aminopeptidase [Candidatus Eiseniibacteriota bacterium]|nr:MAG: prolyl aminopeptidase [Candidatus Eisenbacteria bacterium]
MQLWPEIEPFQSGYLKVSDIHEIYYELCGNPRGTPVFVLHGGPGAGCSPYYRRFFNPEKFLVVLHDQRGCGRSRPFAELRDNTTQHLVQDIETLRTHLELDKIILFGGSWGSTLALAYGETYPEQVTGMVLRGIFLATQEEQDHYYHGGVNQFFPEAYERLLSALPDPAGRPLPDALLEQLQSEDEGVRDRCSIAWVKYTARIGGLQAGDEWVDEIAKSERAGFIITLALFENYYLANGCFLEEGQLLDNADRIKDIPVFIVNGRYDMVCPPVSAYRLHLRLPVSELVIAEAAGHWMGEKPIEQALLKAMRKYE